MNKKISDLSNSGNVDEAVKLLIKEIDSHPKDTENYLQLSTYLIEQGSVDQAQQLLEQAQHLVKNPIDLAYNLAVCYYMQGDFDKAIALLDQIPNDDLTLYQKALVYFKLGQHQKALAFALTIKNVDEKVKELIGDIWLGLGQLEDAEKTYKSIPKDKRTAKIYFLLGITVFSKNRDQAEEYFNKSKQMDSKYYQQAKNQYGSILKLISDKGKKDE